MTHTRAHKQTRTRTQVAEVNSSLASSTRREMRLSVVNNAPVAVAVRYRRADSVAQCDVYL
jgi:hypothetical protein